MTLSPKHLNFDEMWKLYQYLKDGISGKQEEYLLHEISNILDKINQESYLKSLSLLYDNKIEYKTLQAVDSIILFIDGLNFNKFFDFCNVMESMNGTS